LFQAPQWRRSVHQVQRRTQQVTEILQTCTSQQGLPSDILVSLIVSHV